jgi:hypothetical protein
MFAIKFERKVYVLKDGQVNIVRSLKAGRKIKIIGKICF